MSDFNDKWQKDCNDPLSKLVHLFYRKSYATTGRLKQPSLFFTTDNDDFALFRWSTSLSVSSQKNTRNYTTIFSKMFYSLFIVQSMHSFTTIILKYTIIFELCVWIKMKN